MRGCRFIVLAAVSVAGAPTASHASGGFDGRWTAIRTCPTRDASGGSLTLFDATVVAGRLTASHPASGAADVGFRLSGRVDSHGAAVLHEVVGEGVPEVHDGARPAGASERRSVRARFGHRKGLGREDGARPCEFSFLRSGG